MPAGWCAEHQYRGPKTRIKEDLVMDTEPSRTPSWMLNYLWIVALTALINILVFIMIPMLTGSQRPSRDRSEPATVVTMDKPQLIEKPQDEQKKVTRDEELKPLPEKDVMPDEQQNDPPPPPQIQLDLPRFDPALAGKRPGDMAIAVPPAIAGIDSIFNLNELDQRPRLISRIEPLYPYKARQEKISGKVLVKFIVDRHGMVKNPAVVRSEPPGVFDNNTVDAVLKWRFEPGMFKGKPVDSRMTIPIRFDM